MKKHVNISIYGKVQGVFYRKNAQEAARQIGIKGYVMNKADGSVYIEAEGSDYQIDKFIDWCKRGPEEARVERIEVEEGELKNYIDFSIKYM